jgi:hypothetical protein
MAGLHSVEIGSIMTDRPRPTVRTPNENLKRGRRNLKSAHDVI